MSMSCTWVTEHYQLYHPASFVHLLSVCLMLELSTGSLSYKLALWIYSLGYTNVYTTTLQHQSSSGACGVYTLESNTKENKTLK